MARKSKENVAAPEAASVGSLQSDDGVTIPRIRLGEVGFSSLKVRDGKVLEEANRAFLMPSLCKVVAEMELSPPVAIGLNAIRMLMNRSEVYVEPFDDTQKSRERAKFLESCLHDMDDSWQTTAQSFFPVIPFGHHISEKVYRRRLKKNGSKYDDGLVGLKALRTRPQATISKWNFSVDGRTLESISQNISNLENSYLFSNVTDENGLVVIPRDKFLLFNTDPTGGNPLGSSVLKSAYLAHKQLTLLQDNLMVSIAKDSSGLPLIELPPNFMSATASDSEKAVYDSCKALVDNLASGQMKGIIFPMAYDGETKQPLFRVSLLEQKGGKSFDVLAIIKTLQANILSVLSCDAVTMSADKSGSLSLQDGDTNLLALSVSYRLGEIANTLNSDLVRQLWELNGFDTAEMPKIKFKDVSSASKEEFSKFVQRVGSVGLLEKSRPLFNKIYEVGGIPLRPDDEPIDEENLTGASSKSGEGMKSPVGEGTRKDPFNNEDASTSNNDNTA